MKKKFNNKNEDDLKLFFSDEKIREEVERIRIGAAIVGDNYDYVSSDEDDGRSNYHLWVRLVSEIGEEIFQDSKYIAAIKKIKDDFQNGLISEQEAERRSREANLIFPENFLDNEIKKLIAKYNLPENYYRCIYTYLFTNHFGMVPSNSYNFKFDFKNKSKVTFVVQRTLTDKDLVKIKEIVNKRLGSDLPPTIKPIKNIDAKFLAEEIQMNPIRYCDDDTSYKMSANEISDYVKEETGIRIKPSDVHGLHKKLDKIRKRRYRKSDTK